MTHTCRERENFYRNSTLIVDHSNEACTGLLHHDLTRQGLTLLQFIQAKQHEIYHLCYNNKPCCMCPPGSRAPVFRHINRILNPAQLDILLDTSAKLPGHNPNSQTKHCCCPANPNINYDQLDLTLTRCLLVNFTTVIPVGSPERLAVDGLIKFRNESYGHATEGKISDHDYQINKAQIEKSILVLAQAQGRESEFKQKLSDAAVRPLDETILRQYQTKLMENIEMMQTLKNIESAVGVKSLPDCLTKDLRDVTVTEGCDAHFEIRTKEYGLCSLWLRDEVEIVRSQKFIPGESGKIHVLDIRNTFLSDKGQYTVRIKDIERHAHLDVEEYFTKNLQSVECVEGDTAEFTCEVKEDSLPARWNKNGIGLKDDGKYEILQAGKLHRLSIKNCELHDTAKYAVSINNRVRETFLVVIEYFTKPLGTMTCMEGESVQFECEVLDDQTALWFKDGSEVNPSDKYKVEKHERLHRLVVINTRLADMGEYSVKIKNCVRHSQLIVQEYFTKNMRSTYEYTEGDMAELSCAVLEDNVTAHWEKDGVDVQHGDRYTITDEGKTHKLAIQHINLQDAGDYCVKICDRMRSTSLNVKEIPKAIQQLSEKDKELYMEIIKSGTETRYYIRVVIIGENGVGKTCLLRRLLGQSMVGVQSTDGVDIHRCKISLSNGQWIFDHVSSKKKELLLRLKKAKNSKSGDKNSLLENCSQSSYDVTGLQDDENSHSNIRESTGTSRNSLGRKRTLPDMLEDESVRREFQEQMMTPMSEDIPMEVESTSQLHHDFITKLLNEEVSQALDDFFNGIEEVDIPSEVFVECGLLDFAGEKEYYATHPIFLNPNAVHLLVTNIMKDVQPINTEEGFDKIGEYVDFWLDSIHCCGVNEESEEETKTEFLYPPTIIVCTRIDECRDHLEERKKVFCKQLGSVLRNEYKKKHIREICYVSNTESKEEDICSLRSTIFKYGKQLKTFAEQLPLKWIRLEHLIDVFREAGVSILSWPDILKLSSKCSIDSQDEINLFLKYQHKVGGVIYFASLKEYIILNQKWLANAFRCLVSDKFNTNLMLSDEYRALVDTGKLEHSLIVKLFDKEPELDFSKHSGHILNVMEIFGIIVKLTTLIENGQRTILPTYYMPCMIFEKASVTDITDKFNANKGNCNRTPWLCIEFDFMPFDFFNHILCHYISQYPMCTEPKTGRMAIYHGMGIFFLDNTKFRKFCLCFCKNTIALQIWQWKNVEKGTCKAMLEEMKVTVERLKERFETRSVSYKVKSKCSDGNIHMSDGRHSYSELLKLEDEYFCEEHSNSHRIQDFFQTWFEDYTENEEYVPAQLKLKGQEGIQDTRFKEKCHVCDKEPSVYWCHGCQRSMCQDCNNQHRESDDTKYHIVQHVQDKYSVDYNFKVNEVGIIDIKVLHDVLVIADYNGKQLVTCDITGQQQHTIPLPGLPWHVAVVDNNTVAVILDTDITTLLLTLPTTVVIVDVRQRQVIQRTDVKVLCYDIMYRDNQLFVGCGDGTIKVMNMSGEVTRTIPVGVIPEYISGGEAGRIYYTDNDKLYCIDTVGNTLFTFTDPNMSIPRGITTDDEGNVLVICRLSNNVLRISHNGKQSQVIITQIPAPSDWWDPYICYNSLSKSVVIGRHDNVYVYKKV